MDLKHPMFGRVRVPDDATQSELDGIMADLDRQAGQTMAARAALDPLSSIAMEMANPRPRPRPVGATAAYAMSPQQLSDIQRQRQGAYEFDQSEALRREEMGRREAMRQQELMARNQFQQQQIGAQTKHYENMTALEKMRYEAQEKRALATEKAKADAARLKAEEGTPWHDIHGGFYVQRKNPDTGQWEKITIDKPVLPEKAAKEPSLVVGWNPTTKRNEYMAKSPGIEAPHKESEGGKPPVPGSLTEEQEAQFDVAKKKIDTAMSILSYPPDPDNPNDVTRQWASNLLAEGQSEVAAIVKSPFTPTAPPAGIVSSELDFDPTTGAFTPRKK